MRRFLRGLALAIAVMAALPAGAVLPDEVLDDPALEARARTLSAELRCMVCQNQSIDDSDAPLARDLRILIRERLTAGDSDPQVIDFLVARYGEFVLLKPRFAPHTLLLWATPIAVLAMGAWVVVWAARRSRRQTVPLTDDERRALEELVGRNRDPAHGA
jgi:cytochrome c-type biogenesis protein CcmH